MKFTYKQTLWACYLGFVVQAIVNNITALLFVTFQTKYAFTFEMIGRLILINFTTQLVVDYIAARYVDRIGYRKAMLLAFGCSAAGLFMMGLLPAVMSAKYAAVVIAMVLSAVGGGLCEVLLSPIVDLLPSEAKSSSMSLLHAFYCWGQVLVVVVTTLLLRVIGGDRWFLLPMLWAVLPVLGVWLFTKVPLIDPVGEAERTPMRALLKTAAFWLFMLLMLCGGACEHAMVQWSSLFAEKGLGVDKVMGDLLGPCMFAVLMGLGRTLYGVKGQKADLWKLLMASGVLCAVCFVVTSMAGSALVSLFACAVCGLSVALMWPGIISLAAERFPRGGTTMFGVFALMGDAGCAAGPWLVGVVSDRVSAAQAVSAVQTAEQAGLKAGLLAAAAIPVVLLAALTLYKAQARKKHR